MIDWLAPYDRRAAQFPKPIVPGDHPTFQQFPVWKGFKPADFEADFVGRLTRVKYHVQYDTEERRKACDRVGLYFQATNDENFEWLCLMEALLEAPRNGTFTMIELGAGYGRWLVSAVCAARMRRPDLSFRLLAVEGDPVRFDWIAEHFRDNQIDPAAHKLLQGVALAQSGQAHFLSGAENDWYGQHVTNDPNATYVHYEGTKNVSVTAHGINEILRNYDRIDLLDMDIQCSELEVVPAGIEEMTKRVRRAFIETHTSDIHIAIGQTMAKAGWRCEMAYDGLKTFPTIFGQVPFVGGVSYWVNPSAIGRALRRTTTKLGFGLW